MTEDAAFAAWRDTEDPAAKGILQAQLVRLLSNHAYAICWIKMRENRPDIVNMAIHRALTRFDSFRGESKFSTWFHSVVQRLVADAQLEEYTRRKKEIPLEDVHEEQLGKGHVADAPFTLQQISKGLKASEKKLLQLKLEGHDEGHIAQELGFEHAHTVSVLWKRLKMKLNTTNGVRRAMVKT